MYCTYQVVANCLSALQEILTSEASSLEEASREREALLSKAVVYYLLNRYVLYLRNEEPILDYCL